MVWIAGTLPSTALICNRAANGMRLKFVNRACRKEAGCLTLREHKNRDSSHPNRDQMLSQLGYVPRTRRPKVFLTAPDSGCFGNTCR